MDSNKARVKKSRRALTPQRSNGRATVAAVLEAGAAIIAQKGYDATTMAEIAARAKAPIGSLYRFFPNKEALADALIQRYAVLVNQSFDAIDRQAAGQPLDLESVADAILYFTAHLQAESRVILALLESRSDWSARRREFRELALTRIANTLMLCSPRLPEAEARDMAVILLQNTKTMKALKLGQEIAASAGAVNELRVMNRAYVLHRLSLTGSKRGSPNWFVTAKSSKTPT